MHSVVKDGIQVPMTISVAMATYNGERFIEEQLTSILEQTLPPDEIVVCDDSSTDATFHVVEGVLERYAVRSRVFRTSANVGVTRAFEASLGETTGHVVFLADQDDVWYPNKIEAVMNAFEQWPHSWLVIHDIDYCDAGLRPIGQSKLERFAALGRPLDSYVTGMATAVKRDLLNTAFPIPKTLTSSHDNWLHWIALATQTRSILHSSLAAHRRHASNATGVRGLNLPRVMTTDDASPLSATALQQRLENLRQRRRIFEGHLQRAEAERDWVHRVGHDLVHDGVITLEELRALTRRTASSLMRLQQRVELLARSRSSRLRGAFKLAREGGYESLSQVLGDLLAPTETSSQRS